MSRKCLVWTHREVETFLCILGEEDVQRDLDGAVRNEKVFQLVSKKLLAAGFEKNAEQCRQKSKKLRAEYRKTKDHNNRDGDYRKMWKWFNMMDAIYGHRLESKGAKVEVDAAASMLGSHCEPIDTSHLTSPAAGTRRATKPVCQSPSLSTRLKELNPEEVFLLSLAPMLQSLEPEKLSEAKIEIMSVIHRAQFN